MSLLFSPFSREQQRLGNMIEVRFLGYKTGEKEGRREVIVRERKEKSGKNRSDSESERVTKGRKI